jgi:hypothetical protein
VRTGAPTCMWCDSVYTVNLHCQACQKYFLPHHFKAYGLRENAGLRLANWRYIQTLDLDSGRRLWLIRRGLRPGRSSATPVMTGPAQTLHGGAQ